MYIVMDEKIILPKLLGVFFKDLILNFSSFILLIIPIDQLWSKSYRKQGTGEKHFLYRVNSSIPPF